MGMAAAISATVRAEARVITPPVIQAAMLMGMEPASASTTPLFKKIPDPTIIPTTRDNASKKVKLFSGVLLFILRLPILLESP